MESLRTLKMQMLFYDNFIEMLLGRGVQLKVDHDSCGLPSQGERQKTLDICNHKDDRVVSCMWGDQRNESSFCLNSAGYWAERWRTQTWPTQAGLTSRLTLDEISWLYPADTNPVWMEIMMCTTQNIRSVTSPQLPLRGHSHTLSQLTLALSVDMDNPNNLDELSSFFYECLKLKQPM